MSLTQTQIIRSLADALSWLEKELAWGVSPANLGHLTGRIGELYAAMVTRGQMALAVNQQGYDVVSAEGEHISVKTVTSSNHVRFNPATFDAVDRIIVLRINVDEDEVSIEELLDCPASLARGKMRDGAGGLVFPVPRGFRATKAPQDMMVVASASYGAHKVLQMENGTIVIETDGFPSPAAKPVLREIARALAVDLLNRNGNPKNTRSLGADVIRALNVAAEVR